MPKRSRTLSRRRPYRVVMSVPSMMTLPRSGRSRPIMSLNSTVLPLPLRPITARISPLRTRKLIPFRTCCLPNDRYTSTTCIMRHLQHRRPKVIADQNPYRGHDHGLRHRLAHAFRAKSGMKALVATDPAHDQPKAQRFVEADLDVIHAHE